VTLAPESPAASVTPAADQPRDLTVFYDPLSYTAYDHPYETYRQLRDHAPVYYNAERDLYVVSRYADVKACLRNHEQMINALGNDIDGTHDSYGVGMLVCQDPPRHAALRDAIRRSFGGREILAMEDGIRDVARRLLAEMRRNGSGDFTSDVALPLAFDAALRLVGAPVTHAPFFIDHLWRAMVRTVGHFGVPGDAADANRESEEHLAEIVERRRKEIEAGGDTSGADAITQILLSVEKGKVYPAEIVGLAHLVLSAATDAPAALLSNCIALLDRDPELQRHLAEHPAKIVNFVEEVLRFESPAQNLCRQTTAEITVAGVTIPANSRVMVLMASANRDERVFANPDTFDVEREFTPENKTLAFGEGIHSCMGAPLARLTARVMVEELLDGSEVRVVGMPERWVKQMVRGYAKLPVTITGPRDKSERPIEAAHHRSTRLTLDSGWSVAGEQPARAREFEAAVRVEAKEPVAEGVVALTLREVEERPLPPWQAGAHVDLILDEAATRQYSLCGDPGTDVWRLGILRDPAGSGGSLYVHDKLKPGDVVQVRGPRNNFPLVESVRYLFIAGGIGITPILPMIRAAEAAGAEWELVYGGRQRASMAFLNELAPYGDKVVVRPQDEYGLLDLDNLLGQPQPDTKVYCCGPEPLLAAVEQRCATWPKRSLHVERFVPKPLTEPVLREAFEVYLAQSDITLTVPPERSILSVVEDAGLPVLSSCAEGTCGTCETAVLDGVPDHRDSVLDEDAREAGDCMMICVSRACTHRLVLDL
jgi:cytochrome P450/ferredoxin-NADP reductase